MEFIAWAQETPLSIWIRESSFAIFALLIVHTISMAFLVGVGVVMALRAFGLARGVTPASLRGFYPVMATALPIAVVSGLGLVWGYPAKALTNVDFYIKLAVIVAALWTTGRLMRALNGPEGSARRWGVLLLVLWAGAITAGRLLAYTHHILLVY